MTEQATEYAVPGQRPRGALWLAFTSNTGARLARAGFERRFGYQPERVISSLGLVLAGPVREGGDEHSAEDVVRDLAQQGS